MFNKMPKLKTSKEEVLQKVIPMIRTRGVLHSSMSELAKACDIQKSHFYYYFKNKEQLIEEVLKVINSYFNYNFFRIIDNHTTNTTEKITKIKALVKTMFTTADTGCIMANTAIETSHLQPSYEIEIKTFFEDFISGLKTLLVPNYTNEEATSIAEQIVQDIEGGVLLMGIYKDQKYLNSALNRMEKLILKLEK